jgi:putative restriction endonuclease
VGEHSVTKVVLTTKVEPSYDDLPEFRYHFPKTYLRAVESAIGDWIVYYEPRRSTGDLSSRGGRQSYFATARIVTVRPDPTKADHFYAYVDAFLPFDNPVRFEQGGHYFESGLKKDDGSTNRGAFGRAVRQVSDMDYRAILMAGFTSILAEEDRPREVAQDGFADEPATFERPIIERVVARPFRDAVFASAVKTAYENTCAVTGLKIINGGGRSEVQAAHIRPVSDLGPDSVRNGLALCGTVHWMFDRGLISLDDDYRILMADEKVPETIRRMVNPGGRMIMCKSMDFT